MATLNDITNPNWSQSLDKPGTVVQGYADIRQCIYIILYTVRGSDPLRPEFGCGVFDYLDKPINQSKADIVNSIIEALQIWEPRINVLQVTAQVDGEKLKVNINFQIKNTVNIDQADVIYNLS
jgi:phage baseplate assembly protein W